MFLIIIRGLPSTHLPDKLSEDLKEYQEAGSNIWDKVNAQIKSSSLVELSPTSTRPRFRHIRVYAVAASLLIIFATSYFWLASLFHSPSKARPVSVPVSVRDVAPGGNKATLTLANGSTIVLENAADGSLAVQGQLESQKKRINWLIMLLLKATVLL